MKKDYKKNNFEKDVMHLIETNHQIKMTSEYSVSSNTSFKKHLNTKSFSIFGNTEVVVRSMILLLQCLLQRWFEHARVM